MVFDHAITLFLPRQQDYGLVSDLFRKADGSD